jgi:hypothetical protein
VPSPAASSFASPQASGPLAARSAKSSSQSVPPPSSGGAPGPTATPTLPPDCGQSGQTEDGAVPPYASDPSGSEGATHATYGSGLETLDERDAFRATIPAGTDMGSVDNAIARGCSATWIRAHLNRLR